MQGKALDIPELVTLGEKYGKIPGPNFDPLGFTAAGADHSKIDHPTPHCRKTRQVFDFNISDEDMALIESLDQDKRVGPDPDDFDF